MISFLHRTLAHWADPQCCEEVYLHKPRAFCVHGEKLSQSIFATLPCGDVYAKDMVLLRDGSIGKVITIWQTENSFHVQVNVHKAIPGATQLFELDSSAVNFVDPRMIVEPVCWYAKSHSILAVLPEYV